MKTAEGGKNNCLYVYVSVCVCVYVYQDELPNIREWIKSKQ